LSDARDVRVSCRSLSKRFLHFEERVTSIRELIARRALGQPVPEGRPKFHLRDLNLDVGAGEAITLVGGNGSGKSTALRLMAGVYEPTSGTVSVRGRLTAIVELGVGFHLELSGRENIRLYAAVMGMAPGDLAERYDDIVAFSGVAPYIDEPLKYYSTGMQARLAFSVAVATDPEVLLVDEVLAVGDFEFRERCIEFFAGFMARGGTLIAVSHDLDLVRTLCSRAVWLDGGVVRMESDVESVARAYVDAVGIDRRVLD
jgi:lipopolysaccharide transport system ATP-binding protein